MKLQHIHSMTRRQQGATLVVSLVILLIVTLFGVASMRSSNLELKMVIGARDRSEAFQAAESALDAVETTIRNNPYTLDAYTCTGANCFDSACTGGLCFGGTFEGAQTKDDCLLVDPGLGVPGDVLVMQPWRDNTNWDTANRHKTINVLTSPDTNQPVAVKYLVEFMCFVPRDENAVDDGINSRNAGVPLYRITVRATGEADRSVVMLQSTYRAAQ